MSSFLRGRSLRLAVGLLAVAYPVLVYFGLRLASPAAVAILLLAMLALRLVLGREDARIDAEPSPSPASQERVAPAQPAPGEGTLRAGSLPRLHRRRADVFAPVSWIAAAGALLLVSLSPLAGLKSYPILVNLGFAALFAHSLWRPPTVIERIARLRHPDLPISTVPYLRKVTAVWLGFFLGNAAISAATAVSGSLELWTLYNGFVSYVLIGLLFAGEWVLRGFLRHPRRGAA
jgi:uncharacterized membrane protein